MGLFKELVLLPLAPVRGTTWVAEQLAEEADRRLYDEENIKREMLQLELDAEEGRIGEKERAALENDLLDRLAVARRRRADEQRALADERRALAANRPEDDAELVSSARERVSATGGHDSETRTEDG
jgi:Gas vesicle protein G